MTISIDIEDLITRLQAATGPDRSLDRTLWHLHCGGSGDAPAFPPHYTSSLDAARTLVPAGLWCVSGSGKARPNGSLYGAVIGGEDADFDSNCVARCDHEWSEAIAVCIAALKSRKKLRA